MKTHTASNSESFLQSAKRSSLLSHAVAIAFATLLISGCTDKQKPATQILAKVNSDEISVHQVNSALAQMQHIPPENMDLARKSVLDNLINQQLAVQQAVSLKLDRSADVQMQIDASKREILTRAYLGQFVASLPKPSAEDAKNFYNAHPELFAERRIYNLQEITLQNPHPAISDLQKMVAGKSMAEIEIELVKQSVAYSKSNATRAAEQIALPILTELAKMQDGQTSVIEMAPMVAIVRVDQSQLSPIPEEIALQRIPQYLGNEQAQIAIKNNFEQLKRLAKITYTNQPKLASAPSNTKSAAPVLGNPMSVTEKTPSSTDRAIAGMN